MDIFSNCKIITKKDIKKCFYIILKKKNIRKKKLNSKNKN